MPRHSLGQAFELEFPFIGRNFAEIDGLRMHYVDVGQGPVVLLLHGNPTWSFYFRNLITSLSAHFRVIAPDFLGMGLSDHPKDRHFRALDRIGHLQELVAHLKLSRFSLVMHDWGGPIGTGFAVRNIPAIERMVYLNTTLTETESLPKIIKLSATPGIGTFLTKHTRTFLKIMTRFGVVRKLPAKVRKGYLRPYRTRVARTAIWDFVDDIPFDNNHPSYSEMMLMADKLPELRHVPVQIVWGLKDPCFHREMLNKVAHHFPQAGIVEIPDASHLVLEDAPDLCAKVIGDFLQTGVVQNMRLQDGAIVRAEPGGQVQPMYARFREWAEKTPHQDAAIVANVVFDIVRYAHINFRDLGLLINKYQRGLTDLGLRPGDKVLMLVPAGIDFLALSYAIMARGATPVFVDPGIGLDKLLHTICDLKPEIFIGSAKAQLLRILKRKLLPKFRFHVVAAEFAPWLGPSLGDLKKYASTALEPLATNNPGLIAFTSGATGSPKGVVFTADMLNAQLKIFSDVLGLDAGRKDLPLLPIFSLYTLALGSTSIFAPLDSSRPLTVDPSKIVRIIEDLAVDFSFGSPTLWHKIAEYCARTRTKLASIKRIFMAGAPVPPSTLERVKSILEAGEIYTPYGATEALPVTFISGAEILSTPTSTAEGGEQGTLVGRAVPGIELMIIAPSSGPINQLEQARFLGPGQIGEIIVRGKNVSPGYLARPDADAKSKIKDGTSFWHRMGDMGYLDSKSNLFFCGRAAHVVSLLERTYYSEPVERIFNQHPKVKRSALVPLKDSPGVGVAIEPLPQFWPETAEKRRHFIQELKELGRSTSVTENLVEFFFHASFPVDARHNAKIFRDKLGAWADTQRRET